MNDSQNLERSLHQAAPGIREGAHKQWLKETLLREADRRALGQDQRARWGSRLFASRAFRVAAACVLAALLVGTGWAAERVYEGIAKRYFVTMTRAQGPAMEISTPAGEKTYMVEGEWVGVWSSDPSAAEIARGREQEARSLIAARRYEYVRSFESPGEGTQYVYKFTLSDGQEWQQDFAYPLEKVSSWEDYVQKVRQQRQQRNQAIAEAMTKGNFRLLDIDLIKQHVCRERSTGHKLAVLEVHRPDGTKVAMVQPYPLGSSSGGYETSWDEHLREIRAGARELLDVEIIKQYTYEMTLADASKTTFTYGGEGPLVKGSAAKLHLGEFPGGSK